MKKTTIFLFALLISSLGLLRAQTVDITLEPNGSNTLDVYLTANGASYSTEIFNSVLFTVRWDSTAGYDLGAYTSVPFDFGAGLAWNVSAPVVKQGAEITNGGLEYQTFGFAASTQTFNPFGTANTKLDDGVKTLIGSIDVTGASAAGLDVCSFKYSNDTYTNNNNANFYVEIAGAEITGNTAAHNSIVSTYSSSSWDVCELSNLEANDTAIISDGNYTLSSDVSLDYIEVASGAGLEVTSGTSVTLAQAIKLEADASGYGQYIGDAASIDVSQYVGTSASWRHLGIPVDGNVGDVVTLGGADMNFGTAAAAAQNLFTFNNTSFSWEAVATSTTDIGLSGLTAYAGGANFPVTDGLINFSGTSKAGNQAFTYGFASSPVGDADYDGWNLIANPYPCNVDFNTLDDQDAGVFSSYSVWDGDNAVYQSWNGSVGVNGGQQYIAAGQAFWIKSSGNDGVDFDFTEADRTFSGGNVFVGDHKTTTGGPNVIRLTATSSTGHSDETVIYFPQGSLAAFDQTTGDAHKPWNASAGANNLFSYPQGSNDKLAINAYGTFTHALVIPVGFSGDTTNGIQHTISLNQQELDAAWGTVYLEDLYLNVIHNLSNGDYSFAAVSGTNEHRFNLNFKANNVGLGEGTSLADDVYAYRGKDLLHVAFINPLSASCDLQLFDLAGREVYAQSAINTDEVHNIPTADLAKGMYLIKLKDNAQTAKTLKVMID